MVTRNTRGTPPARTYRKPESARCFFATSPNAWSISGASTPSSLTRTGRLRLKIVITSPLLTSITFPNSDEAANTFRCIRRQRRTKRHQTSPKAISRYFLCLFGEHLNRKLFRQFQLGLAQLEAPATQIALRAQRQHDEVIPTQQSHHHHRAFE